MILNRVNIDEVSTPPPILLPCMICQLYEYFVLFCVRWLQRKPHKTSGYVCFPPSKEEGDKLRSMTVIHYLEDLHCETFSEDEEYDEEQIFSETNNYPSK